MRDLNLLFLTIVIPVFTFAQTQKIDTTWQINKDKFRLVLTVKENKENPNSSFVLLKNGMESKTDSLLSEIPLIYFQDFNNDSIKDLLIYKNSGARSNERYYLYLYNQKSKTYNKVSGFDNWPNMGGTTERNILSSLTLTGTNTYKFFELKDSGELKNLDITVTDSLLTGIPYEKGLEKAKKLIRQ